MASEECFTQVIPDDILTEFFLRLPGLDVVKSCMCVCKHWHRVASSQTLWKDKCARDLYFSEDVLRLLTGEDFKVLYFKNPYGRNLIKNPDASKGMNHWTVTHNGGDGWQIEAKPIGADAVEKFALYNKMSDKPIGCWSSSYMTCKKEQTIDLVEHGCSKHVLDQLRPDIKISEWFSARFDCGIKFKVRVKLYKDNVHVAEDSEEKDNETLLDTFDDEFEKPAGRDWFQMTHTFSGYPPGLRYIQFIHGGKDTQFWAGHFGAKMTLATVKFDLRHCAGTPHSPS